MVEERIPQTMAKDTIKGVGLNLGQFIKKSHIPQAEAAKAIGVSTTKLNQFCNGKYPSGTEALARKALHYMNTITAQRRNRKNTPDFVETTVAKRIFTAIKHAEAFSNSDEAKICMVVGDAGHGKSKCLQEYVKSHPNSIYVRLDDTMTSKAVFVEIAKALNETQKTSINTDAAMQAIIQQMVEILKVRAMLIILDESSGLKIKQLNQLRQIITVRAKRPLVVAGNNQLLKTINMDVTRCGNESLDQFRSRLMSLVDLDKLAASSRYDGGDQLYTAHDIRTLYEQLGVRLSSDAVLTLKKICQTPQTGRLRTCSHIVAALCKTRSVRNGKEIDAGIIFQAIEELGLPIMDRLPFTWNDICQESQDDEAMAQTA